MLHVLHISRIAHGRLTTPYLHDLGSNKTFLRHDSCRTLDVGVRISWYEETQDQLSKAAGWEG